MEKKIKDLEAGDRIKMQPGRLHTVKCIEEEGEFIRIEFEEPLWKDDHKSAPMNPEAIVPTY